MAANLVLQMQSFAVYRIRIVAGAEELEDDTRILPFRLMERQAPVSR